MFSHNEELASQLGYNIIKDGKVYSPWGKEVGTHGKAGYLYFETKDKKVFIHRFQAYHKFGDKIYTNGMVVRHLNGNRTDNSWDNIEIGTNKDNAQDEPIEKRTRIALHANKYSVKARKKLSDEQEIELVKLRKDGYTLKMLKDRYGLKSITTVENIIHRRVEQLVSLSL